MSLGGGFVKGGHSSVSVWKLEAGKLMMRCDAIRRDVRAAASCRVPRCEDVFGFAAHRLSRVPLLSAIIALIRYHVFLALESRVETTGGVSGEHCEMTLFSRLSTLDSTITF